MFGDGGPTCLSLIQEEHADACAAAYCRPLAGLIMFAFFFGSAAAAMGSIAAAMTVWHNEQWIAAASASATVFLVALGKFGHVYEFPFTVFAEREFTVASTAMGLVPTTPSPQDGQADLQGQPWKSLPIKGECELEVTRNLDIIPPKSWLELRKNRVSRCSSALSLALSPFTARRTCLSVSSHSWWRKRHESRRHSLTSR